MGRPGQRTCGEFGHMSKRTHEPCGAVIGPDATACKWHGGTTRRSKAAVEKRRQRRLAAEAVHTYGLKADIDPADALLDEVRWTAGHVAWLRERVQDIEQDALVWGVAEQVDKQATEFGGTDTTTKAAPNVWLELYRQERKHLVDVCKAALSAGVEERRVRLAEQAGAQLAQVIRAVLGDLGVADDPRVPAALQRAITELHAA